MKAFIKFHPVLIGVFLTFYSSFAAPQKLSSPVVSVFTAERSDTIDEAKEINQYRRDKHILPLNSDSAALLPEVQNKRGRMYSVSGMGFGFTGGKTNVLLKPKFSTNLGLDISLGRGSFFLYPSAEFLTFRYDQQVSDADYVYNAQKSRASYKVFTISLGYRETLGKLSFYQFAGIGGGLVIEPRMTVNMSSQQTILHNRKSKTLSARGGLGIDYRIGQFMLFAEGTHLHNFKTLQERKILVFPVYLGLKSNISSLFYRKVKNRRE